MTTTMQNYGITWTDADGMPRAATVAYDKTSAEQRKGELEAGGCSDVEIVAVTPGELPAAKG